MPSYLRQLLIFWGVVIERFVPKCKKTNQQVIARGLIIMVIIPCVKLGGADLRSVVGECWVDYMSDASPFQLLIVVKKREQSVVRLELMILQRCEWKSKLKSVPPH